jgi:hypothetical protein
MPKPEQTPPSGDRLVGYNLRRVREARRLSRTEASDLLAPYLGKKWSRATWSLAENALTVPEDRVRRFSASEIDAFSRAFNVSISYFFCPPLPDETTGPRPTGDELHRLWETDDLTQRLHELFVAYPDAYKEYVRITRQEQLRRMEYAQALGGRQSYPTIAAPMPEQQPPYRIPWESPADLDREIDRLRRELETEGDAP